MPYGIDTGKRRLLVGAATIAGTVLAVDTLSRTEKAYAVVKSAVNFRERRKGVNPASSPSSDTQETRLDISQGQPIAVQETPTATPDLQATKTALDIQSNRLTIQKQQEDNTWAFLTYVGTPATILVTVGLGLAGYFYTRRKDREVRRTEQQKQDDDRLQNALQGLGNDNITVQATSAIMLITFLEQEGYERFHKQIFQLAVYHFRNRSKSTDKQSSQAALDTSFLQVFLKATNRLQHALTKENAKLDKWHKVLDTSNVNLDNMDIGKANLRGVNLSEASLTNASLFAADLTKANLELADLTYANLQQADFTNARMILANLTGTNPQTARSLNKAVMYATDGLTPEQIEACKAKHANIGDEETLEYLKRGGVNDIFLSLFIKGRALRSLGRPDEAIDTYNQVLLLNSNNPNIYNSKGAALMDLARYEEALVAYNRAVFLDPTHIVAYNNRGYVLTTLERYDKALESFDLAINQNPKYADPYNGKGLVFLALERYNDGLIAFFDALERDPNNVHYKVNYDFASDHFRKHDDALAVLNQAILLDPNDAMPLAKKGYILMSMERLKEAEEAFDQALQIDPENIIALIGKGAFLDKHKKFDDELETLNRVLEIDPNDPNYALSMIVKSSVLIDVEKYEEALTEANKVLRLSPLNILALHSKSNALFHLEKYKEALEVTETALYIDPESKYFQTQKKELEEKLEAN